MNSEQLNYRGIKQFGYVYNCLTSHADEQIHAAFVDALFALNQQGPVAFYKSLYSTAERLNPYKRKSVGNKWRRLCRESQSQRCLLAQLFYELAEGSYYETKVLSKIKLNTILPQLD